MGIDTKALFKMTYGLFVLTAHDGGRDNGCIINTAVQLTGAPVTRVSVAVNKANFTHDMIKNSGLFNLSVLTEETPFEVFRHFGFQSGKDVDKFAEWSELSRSESGVVYLPGFANSYLSCRVTETHGFETHTEFIGELVESAVLSGVKSASYQYYFDNIKPKPKVERPTAGKRKFVCKICGYVYEGDELPADFICPVCKHPASDFEEII